MIPSTQHPPAPGATPGNKTQWEASPGMPGKPVAGLLGWFFFFFPIVEIPAGEHAVWKRFRTYWSPNFLWGREQSGMRCTATVLDQPPNTHLPPRLPASLRRGKSDFSLSLDLHPSTRWWWWDTRALPPPPGPKWGGKGVPHHGGRSHPGIGHPQGRVERGTSSPAVPRCRGTPAQRRPPPRRGRETIFAVAKKVSPPPPPPPDISQAAKLR